MLPLFCVLFALVVHESSGSGVPQNLPSDVQCASDADYVSILKGNFQNYVYLDLAQSAQNDNAAFQTDLDLTSAGFVATGCSSGQIQLVDGSFGGAMYDGTLCTPSVQIPSAYMTNTGFIMSFWIYASQVPSGHAGGTNFGSINPVGRGDQVLDLSDEEVFYSGNGISTFRITEYKEQYVFLFGSSTEGSPGSLPLNQWAHVLVHLSGTDQNIYFNGQLMPKNYIIASNPYQPLDQLGLPNVFTFAHSANRVTMKISNYAIVFGSYTAAQALLLYNCNGVVPPTTAVPSPAPTYGGDSNFERGGFLVASTHPHGDCSGREREMNVIAADGTCHTDDNISSYTYGCSRENHLGHVKLRMAKFAQTLGCVGSPTNYADVVFHHKCETDANVFSSSGPQSVSYQCSSNGAGWPTPPKSALVTYSFASTDSSCSGAMTKSSAVLTGGCNLQFDFRLRRGVPDPSQTLNQFTRFFYRQYTGCDDTSGTMPYTDFEDAACKVVKAAGSLDLALNNTFFHTCAYNGGAAAYQMAKCVDI